MSPLFSKREKLNLALRILYSVPLVLAYITRSLFITWSRGIPSRLFLVCAVLKVALGFSARQIQFLSPSTTETYKAWLQSKQTKKSRNEPHVTRLVYDRELLEDGQSSLLWIGDRQKAKRVVFFFHGGGYAAPMTTGHLEWCWRAYVVAGIEVGIEVAVAVLEYTLTPEARQPVQLRQAASGLAHLLSKGFQPQDIVIGGDSAGGNLAAQLLCHLLRPEPTARKIILYKPLAGAFLVSPWLTRSTDDASFRENSSVDMLSSTIVEGFTRELLGPDVKWAKSAFLLDRDDSCFVEMGSVSRRLYLSVGAHEVFRDQVVTFKERVQMLNPNLNMRFEYYHRCGHDFIILEGRRKQDGECTQRMKQWMSDLLAENI